MIPYADRLAARAVTPSAITATISPDAVLALIGEVFGRPLDGTERTKPFADLGLTSLLAVRLVDRINRRWGLRLGIEVLFEKSTPNALLDHLASVTPATRQEPLSQPPVRPDTKPPPGIRGPNAMAVIGMSGRFGAAGSIPAFWRVVREGGSLIVPFSEERQRLAGGAGSGAMARGGFLDAIDQFDHALFGLSPREARSIDPQQRMFLEQAWLALENAGYPKQRISGRKVGVYVGASPSGYDRLLTSDGGAGDGWAMTGNLTALLASRISYHLDLRGPALTVDTACSSSLVALDLACQSLARGECEMALVGGVSLFLDPGGLELMQRAGMLSPNGRCASFDAAADGIAIGEAVLGILLKPLQAALADGDRIDAVIRGTASNQDGRGNGITAPNVRAQSEVIAEALAHGTIDAASIGLIEAHGTGTPLGDPVEVAGLGAVFGATGGAPIALGSAKANLGHSSEAAGLVGVVKAIESLRRREMPPLAGFSAPNPRIDLAAAGLEIVETARAWPEPPGYPRRAGVSSFGLAGTNAHAVIEEAPVQAEREPEAPVPRLIFLSAESPALLAQRAGDLADWLRGDGSSSDFRDLAATLAAGRTPLPARTAMVVEDTSGLLHRLDGLAASGGDVPEIVMTAPPEDVETRTATVIDTGRTLTTARGEARMAVLRALGAHFLAGVEEGWDEVIRADTPDAKVNLDLPDQPLDRSSHWPDITARPRAATASSAPDAARQIQLDANDPMVADHRVSGVAILHAAALLELGLGLADSGTEKAELRNVAWHRPLVVTGATLDLVFHGSESGGPVAVSTIDQPGTPAAGFTLGSTDTVPPPTSGLADVLAIQARAETVISGGIAEPAPGVWLGPCYRGFDRLAAGPEVALGTLALDGATPPRLRVLDAAIQAGSAVAMIASAQDGGPGAEQTRMPVSLERLALHAAVTPGTVYLLVRRARTDARDVVIDVEVITDTGAPVLSVQGLCLRLITADAAPLDGAGHSPEGKPPADPPPVTARPVWKPKGRLATGLIEDRASLIIAPASDPLADRVEDILNEHGSVERVTEDDPAAAAAWIDTAPDQARVVVVGTPGEAQSSAETIDWRARMMLALARAVDGRTEVSDPDVEVVLITQGAHAVRQSDADGDPALAALLGMTKVVFGREMPTARCRLFDLPWPNGTVDGDGGTYNILPALLADPGSAFGEPVAVRGDQRFEQALARLESDAEPNAAREKPGTVVIIGGFGRLGRQLARRAARDWGASILLVGRSEIDAQRTAVLEALHSHGGEVHGLQADITTAEGARLVFAEAARRIGGAELVVQAAVDPLFGRASASPADEYIASLGPKVAGLERLVRAAGEAGAGRLAVFSSIGAFSGFPGAAGQSAYALQCCFEAALARTTAVRAALRPLVVHWGLWDDPDWRGDLVAQVRAQGTVPMNVEASLDIFERLLTSDECHAIHATLAPHAWRAMGLPDAVDPGTGEPSRDLLDSLETLAGTLRGAAIEDHEKIETLARSRLAERLNRAGLVGQAGHREPLAAALRRLDPEARNPDLARALLAILTDAGVLRSDAGDVVWNDREQPETAPLEAAIWQIGPSAAAAVDLLGLCIDALPDVLAGRIAATDVLFPGGSMDRVEPIYRDQPGLEAANTLVGAVAAGLFRQIGDAMSVVEIGAGTGATTAAVLDHPDLASSPIRYLYTDVSAGFLKHGRDRFARTGFETAALDIERPPRDQNQATGVHDLAIASNVLHATRRIDETLANAAALLRPGGVLVVNENIRPEAFGTLTFGLLDGWWRAEDPAARLAQSPLLDPARWRVALRRAGLDPVAELVPGGGEASQAVILAVKRPGPPVAAGAAPVARTAPPAHANARAAVAHDTTGVAERIREIVADALGLSAEAVDPARPFADYGVDSIVSPQISETVARHFGVEMRATDLFSHASVAALADHVLALGPTAPATEAKGPAVESTAPAGAHPPAAPSPAPDRPRGDTDDADGRIAIIGMAGRFPDAENLDQFWRNLRDGRSAIREIDRFPVPDGFDTGSGTKTAIAARWAGLISDHDCFDPLFFQITPAEAEAMDPQQRLLLEEAWRAVEDAAILPASLAGSRTGVFVGASANSYVAAAAPSLQTLGGSMAILSARLSYLLDLKGPTMPVDTGCSSSLVAVDMACQSLLAGRSDLALAAGVGCNLLSEEILTYLSDAGMASPRGICAAFDDSADGMVPGEAVGVVVLKRLADARRDGDRIRAVILATGINQDGRTSGITAPSALAQTMLEQEVWTRAGIDPATITLVEAHGTGTPLGDPIEVSALTDAFAGHTDATGFCAIGSVKTNIGHAMAGAGIAGLAKTVLALENRTVPMSLNYARANRHIDFAATPFHVATETHAWAGATPRRAALSSFGFSGTNAHMVLEEAPEPAQRSALPAGPWPFVLSAKTPATLDRRIDDLVTWLERAGDVPLGDVAWTLALRRTHHRHRAGFIAATRDQLIDALRRRRDGRAVEIEPDAELDSVLEVYHSGAAVDFQNLFADGPYRVVSLPPHPFERMRYWKPVETVDSAPSPGTDVAGMRHPIHLGSDDWRLADHLVEGAPMLPGAAVIELVLAALAQQHGAAARLEELLWSRPVQADSGGPGLDLVLDGDGRNWRLTSADGATDFASGRFSTATEPAVAGPDPATLRQRMPKIIEGHMLYDAAAPAGIVYGPSFQVIERLHVGDGEALARLRAELPGGPRGAAVLDGAMQTAAGLSLSGARNDAVYVPAALSRFAWHREGEPRWAWARLDRMMPDGAIFDIMLLDEDGETVARMERLFARRMTGPSGSEAATQWLEPRWMDVEPEQVAPHERLMIAGADPSTEPSWRRTASERGYRTVEWLGDLGAETPAAPGARSTDAVLVIKPQAASPAASQADLIRRVETLATGFGPDPRLLVVALGAPEAAVHRAVAAVLRCLAAERPSWAVRLLSTSTVADPARILSAIPETRGPAMEFRLRDDAFQSRMLIPIDPGNADGPSLLRSRGTYVITGATGGIARALARYLRAEHDARLVLVARRWAEDMPEDPDILQVTADVTDEPALSAALDTARVRFGRIDGVFHLAGALADGPVDTLTESRLTDALAAKATGTAVLDRATAADPLAFFCCFGSTAAAFPVAGQAAYGAGNAVMAALMGDRETAVRRGERQGRSLSIGWPLWAEGGMRPPPALVGLLRRQAGMVPIPNDAGFAALDRALRSDRHELIALHGTGDIAGALWRLGLGQDGTRASPAAETSPAPAVGDANHLAAGYITGILGEIAQLPAEMIDPDAPFEDFGIDSIMITRLNAALERDLGVRSKTLFFEHRTPGDLAAYLTAEHDAALKAHCSAAESVPAAPAAVPPVASASAAAPTTGTGSADDDIAIIGVAGIYPGAEDLETFWSLLRDGTDLITEVPPERWSLDGFYDPDRENPSTSHAKWGGFIDSAEQFDPRFFDISPLEAESLDPQARKFMEVAWWALEDAGYGRRSVFLNDEKPGRRLGGVFVGLMHNDYPLHAADARARGELAIASAGYWNAANRVSHFLDFHGPSVAVDTACSASLTAIHMAINALRAGDCTMAIAGGVNLSLHPMKYWVLSKAGFSSTDGRCRSFGEGGDGYVPGEGAGAVILKPLRRARADGDNIRAVIRASAINHGGRTSGYTVPNPVAQGDLITEALSRAGISSDTVSYVEAHGTGTALGDPIEITGLKRAFNGPGCAIGSVKSNVGHLESAAGIVALTKVLAQIKHRTLAPSLHSAALNPGLGIEDSGFSIIQAATAWTAADGAPLRAGISSFGAGGANVHLIVEEPPLPSARAAPTAGASPLPILISARTPTALSALADALLRRISTLAPDAFRDIAGTLALGRDPMRHRLGFGARSLEDAIETLSRFHGGDQDAVTLGEAPERGRTSETRETHSSLEGALRAWCDGAAIDWAPFIAGGFRRLPMPLYPYERRRCWMTTRPDPAFKAPLSPASTAEPSTFEITADDPLLADHRVDGRTVAAGALLLDVAARQAGMAVPCAMADIRWIKPALVTGPRLSLAIETGADAVTIQADGAALARFSPRGGPDGDAGPPLDLNAIGARCSQDLSHDAIYALLGLAGLTYGPRYALLEAVWVGDGEALARVSAEPGESRSGPIEPARLDAALQLSGALAREDASGLRPAGIKLLSVWRPMRDVRWVHAVRRASPPGTLSADFTLAGEDGRVIARIKALEARASATAAARAAPPPEPGTRGDAPAIRLLIPTWRTARAEPGPDRDTRTLIVTHDRDAGLGDALAAALGEDRCTRLDMRSGRAPGAETFGRVLSEAQGPIGEVIFLGGWSPGEPTPDTAKAYRRRRETGTLALLRLVKVMAKRKWTSGSPALRVVTAHAHAPEHADEPPIRPEPAAVLAMAKAIGRDLPETTVRLLDLHGQNSGDARCTATGSLIGAALSNPVGPPDGEFAWRAGAWRIKRLEALAADTGTAGRESPFIEGGQYVITGGSGGIARALARELASRHGASVWLLGRRPLDDTERASIADPERGAIHYREADLLDAEALARALREIEASRSDGRIDALLHAPLVMRDGLIDGLAERDFDAVLGPKTMGLHNLIESLKDRSITIRKFLSFSSSNAYTANRGQAAYAAASAYLDAVTRSHFGDRGVVIDWGLWGEVGRMADDDQTKAMRRVGVWPLTNSEGFAALETVLFQDHPQVLVLKVSDALDQALGIVPSAAAARAANRVIAAALDRHAETNPMPAGADPARFADVDGYALSLLRETLARDSIGSTAAGLERLGDEVTRLAAMAPRRKAATMRKALLKVGEEAKPYLALLEQTVPAIAQVISGKTAASEVLFPDGSDHLVQAIYQGNRLLDWQQGLVGAAVRAEVERRLADEPDAVISILEIGGGTGGTTGFVLDALAPFGPRVRYVFSDIGPSFLVAARKRFGEAAGFEARLLDISRPASEQGLTEASIDIVVAANVLHATPRIADTLGHVARVLRSEGLLVLKEATAVLAFNTLTFGLTREWWGFEDPEIRQPGAPLLSGTGWRVALEAAGFLDPMIAADTGADDQRAMERVFLARAPERADTAAEPGTVEQRSARPAPVPRQTGDSALGPVQSGLITAVAEALHLSEDEIELDASFAEYGADSIISVELVRRINEIFGIELKTTALFNFATVRELAGFIETEFGPFQDTEDVGAPEPAPDDGPADRVADAKGRNQRLRDMIARRRDAAPINAEAEFLRREAEKAPSAEARRSNGGAPARDDASAKQPPAGKSPPEQAVDHASPDALPLHEVLCRLEAGEIGVEQAIDREVYDDA